MTTAPERNPDFFWAEVAMHRAARVARRRAAELPRRRAIRRLDDLLDRLILIRIAVRDALRAWRAGALRSGRDPHFVGAEVAMHRAARVARRRAAELPRRRMIEGRDDEMDREVAARIRRRDRTTGPPTAFLNP